MPTDPNDLEHLRWSSSSRRRSARPSPSAPAGACSSPEHLQLGPAGAACSQAGKIVAQADADYGVAQQDLALRVSTRYFDVLAAQDNVQAQQASLDAISRQLEQADKRFEVGLIAITDVQEARAARDTAAADLIAAKRQLATAQELLREITDMQYAVLATPRADDAARRCPSPPIAQKWVEASMEQNLALTSSRLGADIARDDVRVAFGGHLPQVDLVVGKSHFETGRHDRPFEPIPERGFRGRQRRLDLGRRHRQVDHRCRSRCPSGRAAARSRACASPSYRWQAAKQRLERVSRETERTVARCLSRRASRRSRACRRSSRRWSRRPRRCAPPRPAMTWARARRWTCSPRASTLVGAQTAYSRSRYDYMLNVLRLKQAAGILDRKALEDMNGWLEAPPPPANPPTVDPNAQPEFDRRRSQPQQ